MKNHDRILDALTRSASEAKRPAGELPVGMSTHVLARVRGQTVSEPDLLTVLERWTVGALPAAVAVAAVIWLASPRPGAGPTAAAAGPSLADALFEEIIRS